MKERIEIFRNATDLYFVNKRGTTLQYWYQYVAVFSGSYIYFYAIEDSKSVYSALNFFKMKSRQGKAGEELGHDGFRALGRSFKNLNYEEYFLVKGCQKI